eukprot:768741-Hanusia_phi.AAC.13
MLPRRTLAELQATRQPDNLLVMTSPVPAAMALYSSSDRQSLLSSSTSSLALATIARPLAFGTLKRKLRSPIQMILSCCKRLRGGANCRMAVFLRSTPLRKHWLNRIFCVISAMSWHLLS